MSIGDLGQLLGERYGQAQLRAERISGNVAAVCGESIHAIEIDMRVCRFAERMRARRKFAGLSALSGSALRILALG